MKLNPFKKTKNTDSKELRDVQKEETSSETSEEKSSGQGSDSFSGVGSHGAHKILKGFYVSEKSSLGNSFNHYTFSVEKDANKSEIKKEVSKLFNVKVKTVKILNMPEKRRDFGRHPGERSGFKKAVVVLKEGYAIGQAKP